MPRTSSAASSCTCCPKGSYASAATACCPTASANNCCPLRAHCSPNRGANRCLFRPCLIARPGTAHAAENPCASSSATPPQNSISQASIPRDHRRQPVLPACSLHVFTAVCAQLAEKLQLHLQHHPENISFQFALPSAHRCPSPTAKNRPTESLTGSPNAIQNP